MLGDMRYLPRIPTQASTLPALLLVFLALTALLRAPLTLATDMRDPATPHTFGSVSNPLTQRLEDAFLLAWRQLDQPSCAGLFNGLHLGPRESLTATLYTPASVTHEQRLCRRAAALTGVGRPVTFLCRSFGKLAVERAAATLIHEALHHAGLPERPADPRAMESREINALVARHCGL